MTGSFHSLFYGSIINVGVFFSEKSFHWEENSIKEFEEVESISTVSRFDGGVKIKTDVRKYHSRPCVVDELELISKFDKEPYLKHNPSIPIDPSSVRTPPPPSTRLVPAG